MPAPAAEIPAPTPAPTPALEAAPIEAATVEVWYLRRGLPLHEQLAAWAGRAGWTLLWHPGFTWTVAADARFEGAFPDALAAVIGALFAEGAPVRLHMWMGNAVAEVLSDDDDA